MKNANLFSKQKYHSLTDTENKLIKKVVDKIAENHKDDDWIVIDAAIRARISFELAHLLSDDRFREDVEVERMQEEKENAERRQKYEEDKLREENAEKESDDILNSIISETEEEK